MILFIPCVEIFIPCEVTFHLGGRYSLTLNDIICTFPIVRMSLSCLITIFPNLINRANIFFRENRLVGTHLFDSLWCIFFRPWICNVRSIIWDPSYAQTKAFRLISFIILFSISHFDKLKCIYDTKWMIPRLCTITKLQHNFSFLILQFSHRRW